MPFKGFTARFLQQLNLSCRNLVRAVVLRHCSGPTHLAISHPFGSIQPGAAGFDWSSMTLMLKGTLVMFVSVNITCNTGASQGRTFRNFQRSALTSRMQAYPSSLQGIGTSRRPKCWKSSWPARVKGEILLSCALEISCTSGRLIDNAVCHRSILNIAKLHSFVEGPWKTHQALLLTLPQIKITKEVLHTVARHVSHEIAAY